MKWVITIILLMPIWLYYDAWSHDEYLQSKLKVELKDGLKVATHDAALQVDPEALEEGRVVFLQEAAEQAFLASIQRSYKLDTMLQPLPESIWQTSFRVVHFERVEDGEFPKYYNSGPPFYYGDTLNGPSIVELQSLFRIFNFELGSTKCVLN